MAILSSLMRPEDIEKLSGKEHLALEAQITRALTQDNVAKAIATHIDIDGVRERMSARRKRRDDC